MAVSPAAPTSPQGRFATALDAHLRAARRTGGNGRWTNTNFADAMAEAGQHITEATIRNWRKGNTIPQDRTVIDALLAALFGPPPGHAADRAALFALWAEATGYTAPTPPKLGGLPPPPARYHGRAAAQAQAVATLLGGPGALLLQGTGGIGKTTLAHAVLHDPEIEHRFDERRWHAALATAASAETMGIAIVRALGLDPAAHRLEAALTRMAEAPGLLVLDNLEAPWLDETLPIESLLHRLAQVPSLSLLATFRGEAPPDGPAWKTQTVVPVDDTTALAILCDYAPNIAETDPDWPAFCSALGGLPLAIALIGHRARTHASLSELWAEWQAQGTAIAQRLGVAPAALTSLDHSIGLSLRHASPPALRLFALLGALPAGLADADRRPLLGPDALVARDDLLRLGLAHAPPGRLDLLPPLRRHAQAAHPPAAADAAAWPCHYLNLVAEEAKRMRTDGAAAFARLAPEVTTLEAAFAAAERDVAVAAAWGFAVLSRAQGTGSAAPLLALAARCAQAEDWHGQARCLERAGDIALDRSDHATATARFEEALPLYRRISDVHGEADCILSLGDIALHRSDHATATTRFEEALPLHRRIGDVHGEANCIQRLGDIALARSDHATATARFEEALPLHRRAGGVHGEANCIQRLGTIALARSDHAAATARFEEALPLHRRVGGVLGEANCIKGLGDIALARSDHAIATARYDEALPLYRRIGAVLGEANCIRCLGQIAHYQGGAPAARTSYEAALALYRRIPEPFSIGWTHLDLARLPDAPDRAAHLAAAREAWLSIGRTDLIDQHLPPRA